MSQHLYHVANPGSALGEAVGTSMEFALKTLLLEVADEYSCHYLTSGVRKTKAGRKAKKLLLSDSFGNEYDIDGVIANESMQPLIIFESKYIRYKKHNRDKGSWICNAHTAIKRRYHSIRSSIAILAGNWSKSSLAMMESHDINIFLIPFTAITEILARYQIDFNWGEQEKDKAYAAWNRYNELSNDEKNAIGAAMIAIIADTLRNLIERILDNSIKREIEKVTLELVSNLGETRFFEFASVAEAIDFLNEEDLDALFITGNSLTLFEPPPAYE